ncbi:hypothetical protein M413DRAFT_323886 [Hebeloma cylindrosporum]|uniref:Uncharacterized protein n=1 Tax=Hebeloma cylindrosporum TaxID=76867 RepID=A0A0C2XDG7_HEBCY|nr:hypothetical protein M413DRAFT_323886 [Hebeloma cylindrosporum h7]
MTIYSLYRLWKEKSSDSNHSPSLIKTHSQLLERCLLPKVLYLFFTSRLYQINIRSRVRRCRGA